MSLTSPHDMVVVFVHVFESSSHAPTHLRPTEAQYVPQVLSEATRITGTFVKRKCHNFVNPTLLPGLLTCYLQCVPVRIKVFYQNCAA